MPELARSDVLGKALASGETVVLLMGRYQAGVGEVFLAQSLGRCSGFLQKPYVWVPTWYV